MRTVVKNLKRYKWVYNNKQIVVADKTTEQSVVLDKVGFMSLSRFIIRSLDTMRIDGNNFLKKKLNSQMDEIKKLRSELAMQKKLTRESQKTQKALTPKPPKEGRHIVGDHSQVESGEQV